jgi:hypothetical protein
MEIRGIPFCDACAREQEAYFAIGELTREEWQGLRNEPLSKKLGETLERISRQRGWPYGGRASRFSELRRNRVSRAHGKSSRANRGVTGTAIGGRTGWSA